MELKLKKYINRKFLFYPKTKEIKEVREELYTIMLDKYNDCRRSGMSEAESYKNAIEVMTEYKEAIKEVEAGSSLSALKRKIIGTVSLSSFYFIMLTFVYLFVSMVIVKSFEKTWLIAVFGAFMYLLFVSVNVYEYAQLFSLKNLARWGIIFIYSSLVPIIYVFPSLYLAVMHSESIWHYSWLIVIVIAFFYLLTDYIAYRRHMKIKEKCIRLPIMGLIFTTFLYLTISMSYNLWSIAWIIYVAYLALVSLCFYLGEKSGKFRK